MDVLFQAPPLEAGTEHSIFTIVAMPTQLNGTPESKSKIMAYVVIRGDEVPGSADYPFGELLEGLDVNPYAVPVTNEELEVSTADERAARGIEDGTFYRTRVVRYAGWGAASFPIVEANADYVSAHPEKEKLSFYSPPPVESADYRMPVSIEDKDGVAVTQIERVPSGPLPAVMLPQSTRTMNIDGAKFFPTSESTPRMLLNTSEEWAVYNQSIDTYSVATPDGSWTADQVNEYVGNNPELLYYQFRYVDDAPDGAPHSPQPYYSNSHRFSYPMTPAQVGDVNAKRSAAGGDPWTVKGQVELATRSTDHPFHIHQNPFWLTHIDLPDENGNLVNILPEPRWADVVSVPRNTGRVVFRSRFVDYEGEFVNHCHILLHEDNGMMQRVTITGDPARSNYEPRPAVTSRDSTQAEVDGVYRKASVADSWRRSLLFVDENDSGQAYPGDGFIVETPTPPSE